MVYDPFERGTHPVGVRTLTLVDRHTDRRIPTEIWYPASAANAGRDLDPAHQDRFVVIPGFAPQSQRAVRDAEALTGRFPLLLFSHGFGSDRRQSSMLCTHWASHGYLVASPDHVGNTMIDMMQMALTGGFGVAELGQRMGQVARQRPRDLLALLDGLGEHAAVGTQLDVSRIGVAGHSFGGWTALVAAGRDPRVAAVLALAPVGDEGPPVTAPLREHLPLDWTRPVATLYLAAERDSLLPLRGMHALLARTPPPRRLIVLGNTDHMHFCDRPRQVHALFRATPQLRVLVTAERVPAFSELCPEEPAAAALNALGLAHMDAALRGLAEAERFLAENALSALSRRGVEAERFE